MLLRLIISQVCHCIVTWASKVLTSTSFSLSFAFSMQPGVSCSTIFPLSHHFLPSLVAFLPIYPTSLRQGFYRLCSVSDLVKNCRRKGGGKEAPCIKIRQKQRCGFVAGHYCNFCSQTVVSAVLP